MSYINTTRQSRLTINGVDYTNVMISWSCSDTSNFNDGFLLTAGEVRIGTTQLSQFDYQKRKLKRGVPIVLEVLDPDTDLYVRHPRGLLYVMGEVFDPTSQTITFSMGCKLTMYAVKDDATELLDLAPFELDESRQTFDNVRSAFAAAGKILYQNNQGDLVSLDAFLYDKAAGDPASVPISWYSISDETVLSVSPLVAAAPIPDSIKLSYEFNTEEPDDEDPELITDENTSTYDIKYPGVIFTRVGSGRIPTDTSGDGGGGGGTVCGNSPQSPDDNTPGSGNPGTCSGIFTTVEEPTKKRTTRTEIALSTYAGVGKQVSEITKETYGAAIEVNPQYYADKFAYCRFNYATACNPNGSCSLDGLDEILQLRTVETYSYDRAGTLIERNLEEWRPSLAAAQPFDWRAGVIGGVPTDFTEISPAPLFRAKITNAKYEVVDSKNIETITVSESSAVKSRSGIGATPQENVGGGTLLLGVPTTFPTLAGSYNSLSVTTISGNGSGMRVDISYPDMSGKVKNARVTEVDYTNKAPNKDPFAGGSGQGFVASARPIYSWSNGQATASDWTLEIDNPGEGYSEGDQLTWTESGGGGTNNTFIVTVLDTEGTAPSLSINSSGSGYAVGDRLKITSGALTSAVGQEVSQGIFFSVVGSADSAVNGGKSLVNLDTIRRPQTLNKGHYVNVPVTVESGNGGGASVNIEAINTGIVTRTSVYQAPRNSTGANSPGYIRSLGDYEVPVGEGSGKGLVLELGLGEFRGTGDLIPHVVTVRRIVKAGTGYISGDIVTIPWETIEEDFSLPIPSAYHRDMKISLRAERGTVRVFPSSVGANFEPGDILSVSTDVLQSLGAQNEPGVGFRLRVRRVSSEIELGSLRLDAAEGVKTVTVNTSSSKSSLPDAPDTVASPSIATETLETEITVRADQYADEDFAGPLVVEESLPVPLVLPTRDDVQAAMNRYSSYLRRWYLGDALGLQIGEALTTEILNNWQPMLGFRYIDAASQAGLAMRMDACSWGVSADEAVVSVNGIWCGNVNYDPSSQI